MLQRFSPEGSVIVKAKASSAEIHAYEVCGQACAIAYSGKSAKPVWWLKFKSPERREAKAKEFFAHVAAIEACKAEKKAKEKAELAKPHGFKVGQLFRCSWGYEQTQVDYYEVVELVGVRSVKVRKIAAEREYSHAMQGKAYPVPGKFIGEPMVKQISHGSFKIAFYARAYPCAAGEGSHFSEYY